MESVAEVVPEAAPTEGHEKSNGEAEATVKQVAALVRTLRENVQFHAGVEHPDHGVLRWHRVESAWSSAGTRHKLEARWGARSVLGSEG